MGEVVQETKAQRVERLKQALNPWEHFQSRTAEPAPAAGLDSSLAASAVTLGGED